MVKKLFLILFLLLPLLQGCAPAKNEAESAPSPAAQTLARYLQALVDKDEATLTSLSCPDWEPNALLELDAFQAVETKLEGLSCQQTGEEGDEVWVVCAGKILATYSDEVQEFDLGKRTYRLIQQDGDWLVCGY